MDNEVIINEANLKEIEAKLEDGKYYWFTTFGYARVQIGMYSKINKHLLHCNGGCYSLKNIITIIPTPITPPKPLPDDEEIKKIASKYINEHPNRDSNSWEGFIEGAKAILKLMKDGKMQ